MACDDNSRVRIALDATYSLGKNLSGVGVYSREMMSGLARAHPEESFRFYYRPHRLLKSFSETLPSNASRRLLTGSPRADLFHALNQRLDGQVDRRSLRTVCTFHDLFVMTGEYSSPEFRARFTEQARRAAANSDAIIAVSQSTATQVEQLLSVEPSRIYVVPHGAPQVAAVSAARRENLVLFVGVIQRRKNVGRLVKALSVSPLDGVSRWLARRKAMVRPKNFVPWKKARAGPTSTSWATCQANSSLPSTLARASLRSPRSTKDSECRSSKLWLTEFRW